MGSEDALKFWMQMLQANTVLGADERKHHGKADLKDVCFQGFSVKGLRLKDLIPKALSWGCIPPISKQKHAEMKFSVLSNFLSCFEISWQLHGEVHLFLQIAPQLKNQRRFCLFFFLPFAYREKMCVFLNKWNQIASLESSYSLLPILRFMIFITEVTAAWLMVVILC